MKLDVNPFPVTMINFEKRVLVRIDQAETTKGKNVVVSGQLRVRMMKLRNTEVGIWKENMPRKSHQNWKPTSSFLMEKYVRHRWESVFCRLEGYKWRRSPKCDYSGRIVYGHEHDVSPRMLHSLVRPTRYSNRYQGWSPVHQGSPTCSHDPAMISHAMVDYSL
jgi:hypothetical protein